MDKLVAQYSRPPHQNEMYSEQEQQDLTASVPPLSLKFSLPPVDNVSLRWILLHILFDLDGGMVGGYTSILTSTQAAPFITAMPKRIASQNLSKLGTNEIMD